MNIIYPYRNRDLARIKRSLDSLKSQTNKDFEVFFVDYGSRAEIALEAERLVAHYDFVTYSFHPVRFQPWNKCRALNSAIKSLEDGFCFVADVDMIFHPEFVQKALALQHPEKVIYFKVGFLDEDESQKNVPFSEYQIKFESDKEATGLSMFPVNALKAVNGFDEFYHFWGSEDTDMHVRLKNNGLDVVFYDSHVLLLHQWHVIYRNKEVNKLTEELQVTGIVQLNARHLDKAKLHKVTKVNRISWGVIPSEEAMTGLNAADVIDLCNTKAEIDAFLFGWLPGLSAGIYSFRISEDPEYGSLKEDLKKVLGKKSKQCYSMKEINDKLLLHIIAYYRHLPYQFRVIEEEKSIVFNIALS